MVTQNIHVEIKFNKFNQIASQFPVKVSVIVRKAAFDILARGKAYTPRDTGYLADSATVEVGSGMAGLFGGGGGMTSAIVHWPALYAMYQNFGTRYIAPVLFANRAANEIAPSFIAAMKSITVM